MQRGRRSKCIGRKGRRAEISSSEISSRSLEFRFLFDSLPSSRRGEEEAAIRTRGEGERSKKRHRGVERRGSQRSVAPFECENNFIAGGASNFAATMTLLRRKQRRNISSHHEAPTYRNSKVDELHELDLSRRFGDTELKPRPPFLPSSLSSSSPAFQRPESRVSFPIYTSFRCLSLYPSRTSPSPFENKTQRPFLMSSGGVV